MTALKFLHSFEKEGEENNPNYARKKIVNYLNQVVFISGIIFHSSSGMI